MKTSFILTLAFLIFASFHTGRAQATAAGKVDVAFGQSTTLGSVPNAPIRAIAPLTNGQVMIGGNFTQPQNRWVSPGSMRTEAPTTPSQTMYNPTS